jgi:hypothetical protein
MDALCARFRLHTSGPLPGLCNIDHTNIAAGASSSGRRRHPRGAEWFSLDPDGCARAGPFFTVTRERLGDVTRPHALCLKLAHPRGLYRGRPL